MASPRRRVHRLPAPRRHVRQDGAGRLPHPLSSVSARLGAGGFIAAEEEAVQLEARAGGDAALLEELVRRRLTGEPLAWITGSTEFCGIAIAIDPGVYVPRWHTERLAERAAELLPAAGAAIDVCTGSGALAAVLQARRPAARVVATDLDEASVACARRNGVEAYTGDLFDAVPPELAGATDVIVAVPPYVPTPELPLLQRDTLTFESPRSYDGGADGTAVLRRILAESRRFLRPGGSVLVELGGGEPDVLEPELDRLGYTAVRLRSDEDGDVRGLEAR